MNNVIRFNRHEIFTVEMMRTLSGLINDVMDTEGLSNFNFINYLYGMYDGYLYTDILTMAMEYPADIYERVLDLYREIDYVVG
jgi:hypothetical protein